MRRRCLTHRQGQSRGPGADGWERVCLDLRRPHRVAPQGRLRQRAKPVGVMDARPVLSVASEVGGPLLESPPLGLKASWFYAFPSLPDPHSASFAALALRHHRALLRTRAPAQVAANYAWLEGIHAGGERAPLFVSIGLDSWGLQTRPTAGSGMRLTRGEAGAERSSAVAARRQSTRSTS